MLKKYAGILSLTISISAAATPLIDSALLNTRFINHVPDSQALEYVRAHFDSFIAVSFPCVKSKDEVLERILEKYGKIIHKKIIHFDEQEAFNFVKFCYRHEGFNKNQFYKIYHDKFPIGYGPIIFYVYTCESLETVRKAKAEIRNIYKLIGAIHATDNHYQTLELANYLFSKKSRAKNCSSPDFSNS